ncbi:hypothetical protein SY88_09780 [Clostridiales bacterium PH28_bin88]|nr:hypothetical protein SY88_09780 [Clostridiales bacterium PH28_bin88]
MINLRKKGVKVFIALYLFLALTGQLFSPPAVFAAQSPQVTEQPVEVSITSRVRWTKQGEFHG